MAPIHRARVRKQHAHPVTAPTLLVCLLLRPDQVDAMRRFNQVAMCTTLFCFVRVRMYLVVAHTTLDDELDAMMCCTCYSLGAYLMQAMCTWLQCDEFRAATVAAAAAAAATGGGARPRSPTGKREEKATAPEHELLPVARYRAATLFVFAAWCTMTAVVVVHDGAPSIPDAICAMQRVTTISCTHAILQLLLVRGQAIYWKCSPATLDVRHEMSTKRTRKEKTKEEEGRHAKPGN